MKIQSTVVTLFLLFCAVSLAHAKMYKWVDENGKTHFGDRPNYNRSVEQVSIDTRDTGAGGGAKTRAKRVVIYTTSWCSSCKTAKRYFKQHNVTYTEYDVETSRKGQRDFKRMNGRGVPLILVGQQRLTGFRASAFERLYKR